MNESVRSNSYMMSPNRAGNYGGFSTTSQKLDSLRKTPTAEYSQDYLNPSNMNTSMSFLTLNNSAEKQLNYSRANVSFRQVRNLLCYSSVFSLLHNSSPFSPSPKFFDSDPILASSRQKSLIFRENAIGMEDHIPSYLTLSHLRAFYSFFKSRIP